MQNKKYIWIALAFMPVFFIIGVIVSYDIIKHNRSILDITLNDFIMPVIISILFAPVYFIFFKLFQNSCAKAYKKSKIKWERWEKHSKVRFVTFRILFSLSISIIVSLIIVYIFHYYLDDEIHYFVIFVTSYLWFSYALIQSDVFWRIHQQKKAESMT